MYDAITFGSSTVDVFLGTEAMEKKGKLEYPAGHKILVRDVDFQTGGCGMNVAIGLRRLGCKAGFLGKVGDDANGKMILEGLKEEGVSFMGPNAKGKSGYSVILDSVKHNRTILHYKGANNDLKWSEVRKAALKARWLYLANQVGDSFETEKKLAAFARRNGVKVAFNPGLNQCEKGHGYLRKILDATDMLILNREEASALSGQQQDESIMKSLAGMGPGIICMTNGAKATKCYDGRQIYRLSPHKTEIRERTGAGDAFSSGMLAGMIKGRGIEDSLQLALANSESVIRYFGSRNKLLTWNEAVHTAKRRPGRITKKVFL